MNIGTRVKHPVWGSGTVTFVEQGFEPPAPYGPPRYDGNLNIMVLFDNGGPLGWANNSTNDIKELEIV